MSFRTSTQGTTSPRRWKPFALLAILGPLPAFAKYGDTMQLNGLSPVPRGWVVTNITGRPMMWSAPPPPEAIRASQTIEIKDLAGAPFGTREIIASESPIPDGWVISRIISPSRIEIMQGDDTPQEAAPSGPALPPGAPATKFKAGFGTSRE